MHGKITPEYIQYNINDVRATYDLYLKMMEEFRKYNLDESPNRIYSPASIGKTYLEMMGINEKTIRGYQNELIKYNEIPHCYGKHHQSG